MAEDLVCMVCHSDKNLYCSPKYCMKRTNSWKEQKHIFCLFCCLKFSRKFNDKRLDHGSQARIVCPISLCYGALFEIEHCQSKVVRGIEDLLKELRCFEYAYKSKSLENVMKNIDGSLKWHFDNFAKENFSGQHKVYFDNVLAIRRRFLNRPNTFEECQKPSTFELEWHDWKYLKCENCNNEFNLYQCVNKSECKHLCCLKCFLETAIDEPSQYVICPICQSYCAGTLERYHCKTQINRELFKVIWFSVSTSESLEEAASRIIYSTFSSHILEQQAIDRLMKQPQCFEIFKNLDKYELAVSEYK